MKNGADLTLGFLPKLNKVMFVETKNFKLPRGEVTMLMQRCVESIREVEGLMDQVIEESFRERMASLNSRY